MSLSSEMTRMRSDTSGQCCITVSVSPSRFLSAPFLGPLVRCVVVTCESAPSKHARMIIEVRMSPIARDFQALHATQTVTNTANTHTCTDTRIYNHLWKKLHAYPLNEKWVIQLISFTEGLPASSQSHTVTGERTLLWLCWHVCVCICACVWLCYWIIHLWLVRLVTSKLNTRWEREERERDQEIWG